MLPSDMMAYETLLSTKSVEALLVSLKALLSNPCETGSLGERGGRRMLAGRLNCCDPEVFGREALVGVASLEEAVNKSCV